MSVRVSFALLSLLALSACTEPPQTLDSNRGDSKPEYTGTGSNFVAPGWTQGDRASWTREMTVRTQRGQNEYNKVN